MTNKEFINTLEKIKGKEVTLQQTLKENTLVECVGNYVYEDEDFYNLLRKAEFKVLSRNNGSIVISDKYKNIKLESQDIPNRFDLNLGAETIIDFNNITIETKQFISYEEGIEGVYTIEELIKIFNSYTVEERQHELFEHWLYENIKMQNLIEVEL